MSLPADRERAWAKIQLLATNPEYAGRFRVYLGNLQQGNEESVAARNGFDLTLQELNRRAEAYFRAGMFEASPVFGEALNPNRDFIEKRLPPSDVDDWLAELNAAGKTFPPGSPRGLFADGTAVSLEQAAKANPRWAEPGAISRGAAEECSPRRKSWVQWFAIYIAPERRKKERHGSVSRPSGATKPMLLSSDL